MDKYHSEVESVNVKCPKIMTSSQEAVSVTNVNKSYGKGKNSSSILSNFNMTVKKGTIYSLLGSSGCGKTTMLSSIVGLKSVDSGKILVNGYPPGTKGSGVPGKRVGYMPQEIALVEEFSIAETFRYFGSLYGMNSSLLKRNSDFLIDFLKLPPGNRRINTLSGGQQRRVSFAVALIHNPELLILDEPTVGVDPLLRKSIWSYLLSLTSTGKTTVIITTHYIEESRQSDTVGLMRNGHLLTENSPEALLQLHDTNLLEDVVLKLCLKNDIEMNDGSQENHLLENIKFNSNGTLKRHQDENGSDKKKNKNIVGLRYRKKNPDVIGDQETWKKWNDYQENISKDNFEIKTLSGLQESCHRIKSLCLKNALSVTRNIIYLLFMIGLPALTIYLIGIALGGDLKGLKFGIVNNDALSSNFDNLSLNYNDYDYNTHGCILHENFSGSASLHYLSIINNSSFASLVEYESEEEALQDVKDTKLYGYIYFPENFTHYMKERILFGFNAELETVFGSKMDLHLDLSKKHIAGEMKLHFYNFYMDLLKNWGASCNIEQEKMEIPILFSKPVYGIDDTSFTEYITPGCILGLLFFFSLCGSGTSYIKDEKSGIHARSQVAGVTKMEIIVAHSITNFVILLIQTGLSFACMILAFEVNIRGSLPLAMIIVIAAGLAGISLGSFYSTFCTQEFQMVALAIGTYLPNMFLSGMIWPTINMPTGVQHFSFILPLTFACEAIRSIISRGLGFCEISVWPGFLATILWVFVYLILTIMFTRKAIN